MSGLLLLPRFIPAAQLKPHNLNSSHYLKCRCSRQRLSQSKQSDKTLEVNGAEAREVCKIPLGNQYWSGHKQTNPQVCFSSAALNRLVEIKFAIVPFCTLELHGLAHSSACEPGRGHLCTSSMQTNIIFVNNLQTSSWYRLLLLIYGVNMIVWNFVTLKCIQSTRRIKTRQPLNGRHNMAWNWWRAWRSSYESL